MLSIKHFPNLVSQPLDLIDKSVGILRKLLCL